MVMPEIKLSDVAFAYSNSKRSALTGVNLTIAAGSFTALVGHTGSGKSTLVSLIDGLIRPTAGQLTVGTVTVGPAARRQDLARLRQHVGFVFQFPEQQLFAETVAKDIAFGPENLGWDPDRVAAAVQQAMAAVGLPKELASRSPFMLSGGQMRRVAIAGVLAMQPDVLILDEPTAGLDARSTAQLLDLIAKFHREGRTIILITHQMEQVARYADQVVVMNHGRLVTATTPARLFADDQLLAANQLTRPAAVQIAHQLRGRGVDLPAVLTLDQLATVLAPRLKGGPASD
ncbi:energy-coupling factor transporter ATPase [Limosilactobacillus antri]|uniref:Energy-coupling factor transporter ATP-binding protein EcfA2 n=1 Tax=Limosilactobacillus antri DSM 16041 TaxID=525309 RepID=C8P6B3_9LACO|nr:cobalt ABC transporter, ATP-binding protein [Limosilactobacillus antri DSM 16041]KRK59674.1 cobalt ABC superfamily ATP binding cassette transporter, ABC protein [Limosilactobacillus antri DSM 16041]